MKETLISIIIPCYNSERFISSTLDMLLKQDISDCEIIIVNDGSTDNTLSILNNYESINNISIVNQKNLGVSIARNTGISKAKGKYIYFLDSDDIIPQNTIMKWKSWIETNINVDLITFGYISCSNSKRIRYYVNPSFDKTLFKGNELLKYFLTKRFYIHNSSCLYNRNFIINNELVYKAGVKIAEDIDWLIRVLSVAKNVYYFKDICWNYVIRNNSTVHIESKYSADFFNSFLLLKDTLTNLKKQKAEFYLYCNFFICVSYSINLFRYLKSKLYDLVIEKQFKIEKHVLLAPIPNVGFYSLIIKALRLIPIELLFKFRHYFIK